MVHFITAQKDNMSVETIMGYVNDHINFGDLSNISNDSQYYLIEKKYEYLLEEVGHINQNWMLSVDRPINSGGKFSKAKIFLKKAIRKCIKWYIRDIAQQQVEINAGVVRCINQEMDLMKQMMEEVKRLHCTHMDGGKEGIPDEWYVNFENNFRGDPSVIRERMSIYRELFRGKKKVVDLGCGRGEFLQLMKEEGICAQGVDMNGKMVELCRNNGLEVNMQDCQDFLTEQASESIGGIFASQLVEHISANKLYSLLMCAYDKLEKEGILVLETVNPLTLGVFCYGFYIDPTHSVPVHPAMLRFMVESIGFEVDPVQFINEFPPEYKFKMNEDMNRNELGIIEKLNGQLFGAQDYYLVCRKR